MQEDILIQKFKDLVPYASKNTLIGIGDDTAVIQLSRGKQLLATADMLMEDIHFRKRWGEPYLLGKKSILQNISDIAAMGGKPISALISIAIPDNYIETDILDIYRGIGDAAKKYKITICGGDTIKSSGGLVISVTMLGETDGCYPLRKRAKVGDIIAVTGSLGAAGAGLKLLEEGHSLDSANKVERLFILAQYLPKPRIREGQILNEIPVNAMMDISDGIGADLRRICKESGVGAVIEADKIPIHKNLEKVTDKPFELALTAGEDFELLITMNSDLFEDARKKITPIKLSPIGVITEEKDIMLLTSDGIYSRLADGFTHF